MLAWPWEALYDPQAGFLAQTCQIGRRLNKLSDPVRVSKELPSDQVNILLVTARPYKKDVTYRSISRPLVELIEKHCLPAQVHVLRPPTFDNLREHLITHRNYLSPGTLPLLELERAMRVISLRGQWRMHFGRI